MTVMTLRTNEFCQQVTVTKIRRNSSPEIVKILKTRTGWQVDKHRCGSLNGWQKAGGRRWSRCVQF
jgi:hypothetical protein